MRQKTRRTLQFLTFKENPCITRKFLPNYNGKETPEEKEIMQNLTKEKVRAELQLQKTRYERQLESIKQIDNKMTNLTKTSMKKMQKSCKNNGLNNVKQESSSPHKSFQRKNNGLKKTGCQ